MKEMKYKETRETEVLCEDTYEGFHFVIVSYGTHPCAYIEIPKTHPYYGKECYNCVLHVHGGLTYEGNLIHVDPKYTQYYLGWDYTHSGDYSGYDIAFQKRFGLKSNHDKKWTTEEIFEDVKNAIKELKIRMV